MAQENYNFNRAPNAPTCYNQPQLAPQNMAVAPAFNAAPILPIYNPPQMANPNMAVAPANATSIAPDVLAAAITALTTAVQAFSSSNMARTPVGPILDPHSPTTPYNLGSKVSLNAFNQASKPLDMK